MFADSWNNVTNRIPTNYIVLEPASWKFQQLTTTVRRHRSKDLGENNTTWRITPLSD